jgi:hypothetical protein
MFNLSRPENSLILLAPLASESGGLGLCQSRGGDADPDPAATVFADTSDADYQRILALVRDGKRHLDAIKRFDMPGFRPTASYVREMQRYGILPMGLDADVAIDVYATDEAYWRSLWWTPGARLGTGG